MTLSKIGFSHRILVICIFSYNSSQPISLVFVTTRRQSHVCLECLSTPDLPDQQQFCGKAAGGGWKVDEVRQVYNPLPFSNSFLSHICICASSDCFTWELYAHSGCIGCLSLGSNKVGSWDKAGFGKSYSPWLDAILLTILHKLFSCEFTLTAYILVWNVMLARYSVAGVPGRHSSRLESSGRCLQGGKLSHPSLYHLNKNVWQRGYALEGLRHVRILQLVK